MNDAGYVALHWKYSHLCRSASAISVLSLEMSSFATLLISTDKFICIILNPYEQRGLSLKQALRLIFTVWTLALMILITSFIVSKPRISNAGCIIAGSTMSISLLVVFVLLNLFLFLTICVQYVAIIHVVRKSRSTFHTFHSHKPLLKLGGIIITNTFQWFVISVTSVLA